MVIPRSCSSSRESKKRILPAILWDIMPFVANNKSLRDVLPWSIWAKMHMLRTFCVSLCSFWIVSEVKLIVG